jgi:hypothetical protein
MTAAGLPEVLFSIIMIGFLFCVDFSLGVNSSVEDP